MNNSIYRVTLDVHKTASQEMLNIMKNDNGREIHFVLTDGGKPYVISDGCTSVFRARKPDGTVLYNSCSISDSVITYVLTSQTSAAAGILECELTLYGADSKQITSPKFSLRVEDTVQSDSEIESHDEFTELQRALKERALILDYATEVDAEEVIRQYDSGRAVYVKRLSHPTEPDESHVLYKMSRYTSNFIYFADNIIRPSDNKLQCLTVTLNRSTGLWSKYTSYIHMTQEVEKNTSYDEISEMIDNGISPVYIEQTSNEVWQYNFCRRTINTSTPGNSNIILTSSPLTWGSATSVQIKGYNILKSGTAWSPFTKNISL